ncbi:MAG: VOC family protein, partial [Thermoleophilia bacterium]|nr:VOC family protein [Thermoleophilia bacterium]
MIAGVRYTHTNLVARDWHALAGFYESVFGCVPVPPERDYSGPDLEALTAVPHAALRGVHLRLPGAGRDGPTLEIFEYEPVALSAAPVVNRPGLAHIAFAVDSVEAAVREVMSAGGSAVGEVT